ncbi:hypothetical protein GKO28_16475 [Deefgea sp. CFH1-16]|nr:hypothetical protein [Deefgea sp. CFH1-16]
MTLLSGLASLSSNAQIIDDIIDVNDILATACGERTIVLWVDESAQIEPCLMAYSARCVEVQSNEAKSCLNVMQKHEAAENRIDDAFSTNDGILSTPTFQYAIWTD